MSVTMDAQPVQAPIKPDGMCKCNVHLHIGPETADPEVEETAYREMVTAPLPPAEEGRAENLLFHFVFVPPLAQQPVVRKTSIKGQLPQSLGLEKRRVVDRASRKHFPPPLSPAGSSGLPKSTPPAHSWNQVRALTLESPLQVVTRRAVTSLKPCSCVSSHTTRNQGSVKFHTQTLPPAVTGPGPGPYGRPSCLTTGTLVVPLTQSFGAWLALPSPSRWLLQTFRLGYAILPHNFQPVRYGIVYQLFFLSWRRSTGVYSPIRPFCRCEK